LAFCLVQWVAKSHSLLAAVGIFVYHFIDLHLATVFLVSLAMSSRIGGKVMVGGGNT